MLFSKQNKIVVELSRFNGTKLCHTYTIITSYINWCKSYWRLHWFTFYIIYNSTCRKQSSQIKGNNSFRHRTKNTFLSVEYNVSNRNLYLRFKIVRRSSSLYVQPLVKYGWGFYLVLAWPLFVWLFLLKILSFYNMIERPRTWQWIKVLF